MTNLIIKKKYYTLCFSIAILLFITCHIFDIFFYPEHIWPLLAIRIAVSLLLGGGIFLLFHTEERRYDLIASFMAFFSGVAVTLSAVVTRDGFASPIYAGYFIIFMLFSLLFQLRTKYYVLTIVAVLIQHFLVLSFVPADKKFFILQFLALIPTALIGMITHHVIYSLMINYYQKELYKEKVKEQQRMQRILKEKVREKTADLQKANERLERLSYLDCLTSLYNRRYFDAHLHTEWKKHSRTNSPLSLIMCDIDYFKQYNDFYGHHAGDACLIKVAQAIRHGARRPSDIAARIGGEEFAIVLSNTDTENAAQVAQNIRRILQRHALPHAESPTNSIVSLSFGVATLIPRHQDGPEALILLADEALYRSKSAGRDHIQLSSRPSPPPNAQIQNTLN